MEKKEYRKHRFGLIGRNISYSFSKGYFSRKFEELGLDGYSYENFDIQEIGQFKDLLAQQPPITGFNVTIPYKQEIIPFLTDLNVEAKKIGAVNVIKAVQGKTVGYNTDAHGFEKSFAPFLQAHHTQALILGTGGASKAVAYVLTTLGIPFRFVSRTPNEGMLQYGDLNAALLQEYPILINCTPLGTFPDIQQAPPIPYKHLTARHYLYDLIYNPEKTRFLRYGEEAGATICNGHKMLQYQAEKAWEIWNS